MINISQLHAFCVHFPIVLYPLVVLFEFIGIYKQRRDLQKLGWYFHIATTGSVFFAVGTGILSKENLSAEQLQHFYLEAHELLTLLFSVIIFVLFFLRLAKRGQINNTQIGFDHALMILALLLLFVAGHFGGVLVYQLGFGTP